MRNAPPFCKKGRGVYRCGLPRFAAGQALIEKPCGESAPVFRGARPQKAYRTFFTATAPASATTATITSAAAPASPVAGVEEFPAEEDVPTDDEVPADEDVSAPAPDVYASNSDTNTQLVPCVNSALTYVASTAASSVSERISMQATSLPTSGVPVPADVQFSPSAL